MAYKQIWKPCTMLNPVPAVMVSCGVFPLQCNIITVAWAGTVCSHPAMCSISIRKERFSYKIIESTRKFVINLVNRELVGVADWCGVKSGRDFDKFAYCGLTPLKAETSDCPIIAQSPVNIECSVKQIIPLGSHDMFLAEVDSVSVADDLIDKKTGALNMSDAGLVAYSHGKYYGLGQELGRFGFSVKKQQKK